MLEIDHLPIDFRYFIELIMGAIGDDPPVIHQEDLVCMHDGREAVCDHDRCASLHQSVKCSLNQTLGLGVECAGSFIQKEYFRVCQYCPSD